MKKIITPLALFILRSLAKLALRKVKPIIIGVGGSSGKSSTSLLISKILTQKFKVKETRGKNSETGIPLSILGIELGSYSLFSWAKVFFVAPFKLLTNFEKYDIYVVEMGIDSPFPPKNMGYLLKILKPNVGVLTNIAIEHSLCFDPLAKKTDDLEREKEILQLIAKEEGLLLRSIDKTGRSVVNLDDPNIKNLLPLPSEIVTVSRKERTADFYIKDVNIDIASFKVKFIFLKEEYEIKIDRPLPSYFATIFVLSIATCFLLRVSVKDSIRQISLNFELPPGRLSIFDGIKNSLIFDSSYNSSLESAKGALEMLSQIGKGKRKVGILGDMRELGSLSKRKHEELARVILKTLDFAILIGPAMYEFVSPILRREKFDFASFETFEQAREEIERKIKKDDLILVKGSQNTLFLERAVELLLANKKDASLLCRRGNFWEKMRKVAP